MIFIDWISTPYHASFNRCFFGSLQLHRPRLYIFDRLLFLDQCSCNLIEGSANRFGRFLDVYKICRANSGDQIFLLTYDPVLLPVLRLVTNYIYVFEHNTTPERAGFNKHSIWQKLFYKKITRLAQFQGQIKILKLLKQRCFYLGSPLEVRRSNASLSGRTVFLAPSYRFDKNELLKMARYIGEHEVVIKKHALNEADYKELQSSLRINPVAHIDLNTLYPRLKGVIITVKSRSRGTGWFNEAIALGLPIVITSDEGRALFEDDFPGYPFIDASRSLTVDEFEIALRTNFEYERDIYVAIHNEKIKNRFAEIVGGALSVSETNFDK